MKISEELLSLITSIALGLLVSVVAGSIVFLSLFKNRIYPNVEIDQVAVSGLTLSEAEQLLKQKLPPLPSYQLTLVVDDITVASTAAQLGLQRDYETALNQAYKFGRLNSPLKNFLNLSKTLFKPRQLQTSLYYGSENLNQMLDQLKNKVDLTGKAPEATLNYSGYVNSLELNPGEPGREVITEETLNIITQAIGQKATLEAKVASTSAILTNEEQLAARQRAASLVGKRLIFRADPVRLELNDQKLVSLLTFSSGFNDQKLTPLLSSWSDVVNRSAQDAVFDYNEETLIVDEFIPDKPGLELNSEKTAQKIKTTLENIINEDEETQNSERVVGLGDKRDIELELPVKNTQAETKLSETNELGIRERIGLGESEYDHSIANRIHNVKITTQKINNTIIPPGEEFSFNQTLGEVSSKTGYKAAYVIKNGRTELGDGGGVCQVSTTTFRAALDAGLEITLRLPHSYRVSYYELNSKPGIDATVYAGNVDLRFINDTDHHILLHGEADSDNLYMKIELYGTSDGRSTEIVDHEVWGYVPPPPPEHYPDPSLPTGTKKQIDWAVAGAKAKFTHIIKNSDDEIVSEKTYYSNYQPWAAKYLVGE